MWGHSHGDVKAVNEANSVRGEVSVAMVEAELSYSGWGGAAQAVALEAVAAVAGGAGEAVVGVGAAGTGPDPTRPVLSRGGEGAMGASVESEAAALEDGVAGVGLDGWPDGERAVVNQG